MRRIGRDDAPQVTIEFEGEPLTARRGDSVAAALLAGNHRSFRTTPVSGAARGPFCMMGSCFDCLVEIDGAPNRQACMIEVREGMRVRRQRGAGDIGLGHSTGGGREDTP
ncbi:MAG TPA: (2Fe-2S)-binding protein [Rhizobiales bacterium]|nr:hydrogen cyanide synthase subunit HcnA [bacterium BMS3Bbin10]HDO52734.1 (2Fe-2S)-binding protein [Hyphomicrobiales bacterium]